MPCKSECSLKKKSFSCKPESNFRETNCSINHVCWHTCKSTLKTRQLIHRKLKWQHIYVLSPVIRWLLTSKFLRWYQLDSSHACNNRDISSDSDTSTQTDFLEKSALQIAFKNWQEKKKIRPSISCRFSFQKSYQQVLKAYAERKKRKFDSKVAKLSSSGNVPKSIT